MDAYESQAFKTVDEPLASQSSISRFYDRVVVETILTLQVLNQDLIDKARLVRNDTNMIIDLDSTYSDTFGHQEQTGKLELKDGKGLVYIGNLEIPKIKLDKEIMLGTSEEVLGLSVGVLEGSDIPLGKQGELSTIIGHKGYLLKSGSFLKLEELEEGDTVKIRLETRELSYKVVRADNMTEEEVLSLEGEEGNSRIALVTPPTEMEEGLRLVVEAELVSEETVEK